MKTVLMAAAAAAALLCAPALAQAREVYGSAGFTVIDASPVKLGAATFRVGAQLTPMFGIEGEGSFGVSGDKIFGVEFKLNNEFGGFVTARKAISENGSVIARVGYAQAELEASLGPISSTDEQSGMAFGIGAEGDISDSSSIRLDWTRYNFDQDVDALTVSFVHRFH